MIYIVLYFCIGAIYSAIIQSKATKSFRIMSTVALAITWPFPVLTLILGLISTLFELLGKIFLLMFMSPITYLIILIGLIAFSCGTHKVNAATITGDTPLAGISVLFAEKARQGITWYDPDDLELLAQVIEHENYSTGERAMYLTGAVVINRMNRKGWPNTIHDVIYQKGQYSTIDKFWTRPVHQECYRIASWLLIFGCPDVPPNVVYQATFKQGSGVYEFVKTDYFCYE